MLKGIDVSHYQGEINWEKVKPQIDFAILRCGLGDDIKSQDDKYFERNYAECTRLGIPFAVYFFSYAVNKAKVTTEIAHIKRLLGGKKITAPVYIDVENTNGLNWRSVSNSELLEIMKEFKAQLAVLGYKMGIPGAGDTLESYMRESDDIMYHNKVANKMKRNQTLR